MFSTYGRKLRHRDPDVSAKLIKENPGNPGGAEPCRKVLRNEIQFEVCDIPFSIQITQQTDKLISTGIQKLFQVVLTHQFPVAGSTRRQWNQPSNNACD